MPAELHAPPEPTRRSEPIWLEPYPDSLLEDVIDRSREPHARYEAREAIGLAFVAGLQRLKPRARAVLVLRDVLGFRTKEVAETLGMTEPSVNSALHRARSALHAAVPVAGREEVPLPNSRVERELVARFTDAFEAGDIAGVVALLTDDAWLTMPPEPLEYQGPAAIGRFLSTVPAAVGSTSSGSSRPERTVSRPSVAMSAIPVPRSRTPTGSWCSRSEARA